MAIRVKVREYKGNVFAKEVGVKEYRIHEWELDDGKFEYGLDCPLHALPVHATLPDAYSQRQDEVTCPSCNRKYFRSKSKEVVVSQI